MIFLGNNNQKSNPVIVGMALILSLFFILIVTIPIFFGGEDTKESKPPLVESNQVEQDNQATTTDNNESPATINSFNITTNEFIIKFNNISKSIESKLMIDTSNITVENERKFLIQDFSNTLNLSAMSENSSDKLFRIKVTMLPAKNDFPIENFTFSSIMAIRTVDPKLTPEESNSLFLDDLGLLSDEFKEEKDFIRNLSLNGITYTLHKIQKLQLYTLTIDKEGQSNLTFD